MKSNPSIQVRDNFKQQVNKYTCIFLYSVSMHGEDSIIWMFGSPQTSHINTIIAKPYYEVGVFGGWLRQEGRTHTKEISVFS